MNSDNSGGVIFGGVPLDNYQSTTTPVDNNNNIAGATASPIIPVTPIMNEVPSNTNSDNLGAKVDNVVPSANVESSVIPAVSPIGVSNDVSNQASAPLTDGALNFELPVNTAPTVNGATVDTTPVANGAEVVTAIPTTPNDIVSQPITSANDGTLGFELPSSGVVASVDNNLVTSVPNEGAITIDSIVPAEVAAVNDSIAPNLNAGLPNEDVALNSPVSNPVPNTITSGFVSNDVVNNQSENLNPPVSNLSESVSVGKYLGYMFLFMIPIIGLIMLVVKACDKKDKNISNYAKAQLLFGLIVSVVFVISTFVLFKVVGDTISEAINKTNNSNVIVEYE